MSTNTQSLTQEMCTFLMWMVHCGIWNRCILWFEKLVYCKCTAPSSHIMTYPHIFLKNQNRISRLIIAQPWQPKSLQNHFLVCHFLTSYPIMTPFPINHPTNQNKNYHVLFAKNFPVIHFLCQNLVNNSQLVTSSCSIVCQYYQSMNIQTSTWRLTK